MIKITDELIERLLDNGYIDEEKMLAAASGDGGDYVICANGDIVTLADSNGEKILRDSIDRLKNLRVKRGLFKSVLSFAHADVNYSLTVRGGKNIIEYFMLIG